MNILKKIAYFIGIIVFSFASMASATNYIPQQEINTFFIAQNCDPVTPPTQASEPAALLAIMGAAAGLMAIRRKKK